MNVLILVNGAPYHRPFFCNVGEELTRRGHSVHYVTDSRFSAYLYPDVSLPDSTLEFATYFERHESSDVPPPYRHLNLWTALFSDVDRMEHSATLRRATPQYYQRLLSALVSFFDEAIVQRKIDCVVYENVSNTWSYVAQMVAKERNVRYVGFAMSRLPGRIDVCDGPTLGHSKTRQIYKAILDGLTVPLEVVLAARKYIETIDAQRADYIVANKDLARGPWHRYANPTALANFGRAVRWYARDSSRAAAHQVPNPLVAYPEHFAREVGRYARAQWLRRTTFQPPDLARKFFIYPVQIHPESTVAVDAPYVSEEVANIINISINLPFGTWLYVKDHPSQPGRQSTSFYRRVRRLPNVVLINPEFDSKRLLRYSKGVVTMSSSIGIEAIVLCKPVFVLGHPFYDFHPLVRRIDSWDTAFATLSKYEELTSTDVEREAFVQSYFMSSIEGSYLLSKTHADKAVIRAVASAIEQDPVASPRFKAHDGMRA